MSLITEALRRTRDAAVPPPAAPPVLPVTLPPPLVDRVATPGGRRLILVGGLAVVLAGAGWAGYQTVRARPVPSPAAPAMPIVVAPPPPPPVPEPVVPPPAPVVAEPVKPARALPVLTLQGITRDQAGDEALINNWNVRVGEEIEGARVTSIDSGVVKLEFDGQEIVLRLR